VCDQISKIIYGQFEDEIDLKKEVEKAENKVSADNI
jgi:hypothetical protein